MIQITVYEYKNGTQWDVVVTDARGLPVSRTSSHLDENGNATRAILEAANQAEKMIDARFER